MAHHLLDHLGCLIQSKGCRDHRGGDDIDQNATAGHVTPRPRDLASAMTAAFGRRVGGQHGVPILAGNRGDEYNAAITSDDHRRDSRPAHVERAVSVDRPDPAPRVVAALKRRLKRAADSGPVDHVVDRAEFPFHALNGRGNGVRARDVRVDGEASFPG